MWHADESPGPRLVLAPEQLGAVIETLAEAVTVNDASGQILYANEAAVDLLRADSLDDLLTAAPAELMARFAVYDDDGRPLDLADLPSARVLAGEAGAETMLVRNVVRATGEERWLVNKVSTLQDADGHVVQVVNVIEDVTEVKRAERSQRLLASASEALASTLDPVGAVRALAEVVVPALAESAVVALRGRAETVSAGGAAGAGSTLTVPLQAGSERLGTLTLANAGPGRPFGRAERELAQELGRRAGTAVLNARLYSRRTAIATALQHGLAPPELPEMPGWSAAVVCRPAGELSEVGGDFYDVFPGPRSRCWMLVIGDVAGHGAEAATQTSLARFTARTAAELTGDVSQAVSRLDDTLRSQVDLPLCTVVCASLAEREDGTVALTLASAGHPPPLLVRGREVVPVGDPGTMAGAFEGEQWPTAAVTLEAGDVLALYTDGVLDTAGESGRFGEQRLREALAESEGTAEQRLTGLDERLRAFQRGPQRDDTTILLLEYLG